VLVC
jgi:hypothetical protein